MKGKHKTNNHSNPKTNKKLLFKNTINDIFNGRKDLIFFKTNIQKILNSKIKKKEVKNKNNNLTEKTKSPFFLNNKNNFLTLNNDYSYLRTENNFLKNNYSKNFYFSKYIKNHSLDKIAPKNNFYNTSMSFKIINNQKIFF